MVNYSNFFVLLKYLGWDNLLIIGFIWFCSDSNPVFSGEEKLEIFSGDDSLDRVLRVGSIFLLELLSVLKSSVKNSLFIIVGGVSVWYKIF